MAFRRHFYFEFKTITVECISRSRNYAPETTINTFYQTLQHYLLQYLKQTIQFIERFQSYLQGTKQ